jgi:hypothetical protein
MVMNEELIKVFLDKRNVFAVVGASRDPQKYGYQVYKDPKGAGYKVYPVNPNAQPDVVNVVVPPKVTEHLVETCKKLGITKVWMQLGSESEKAIKFCEENGINVVIAFA